MRAEKCETVAVRRGVKEKNVGVCFSITWFHFDENFTVVRRAICRSIPEKVISPSLHSDNYLFARNVLYRFIIFAIIIQILINQDRRITAYLTKLKNAMDAD